MSSKAEPIIMNHRVDLYIPSQCICTGVLPKALRAKVIEEVKQHFDNWFGGHAEITISGDWRLPDGTIAREEVTDIFSFCSSDSLEEHQEDVDRLAVDIANQLTQDRVLRAFDNLNVALWPNTRSDLKPKKNCACKGVVSTEKPSIIAHPTSIKKADKLSKMLIIQGLLRNFRTLEHARRLFCDVLNYDYAASELPTANWPDSTRSLLVGQPTLIAAKNGFKIVYLRIATDGLRKASQRQVIQRIHKDDPTFRGLIVASDRAQQAWELINIKTHGENSRRFILRRMRVGSDAVRTVTERLATLEIDESEEATVQADDLQRRNDAAFDVEAVTRAFFTDIANWYFWALKHTRFPKDAPKEKDGRDHVSVIRLITRLIFCWFVKEKGLIPAELFDERRLSTLLIGFAPNKVTKKESVFYRAILQNLFFATLNTEMEKRNWRRNGQNFMAHSLYRYKDCFSRPDDAMALFKKIPFLNGGLFECLDKVLEDKDSPRYQRIDGFSDRADSQPTVPDFLFFGEETEVDLSADYGDKKFKKVKVRGLIHTLNHYRFTVEESTPLEEEVALDPELAGKIFENLLAAYNPETGATARKQTGSFYTPREIVNYMVDEALIAYLRNKLEETAPNVIEVESRLRHLFSYEEESHRFTPDETKVLITAIDQLKALDPAVGSEAFPMGILHKLVFILGRLDPNNKMWKERQKARLQAAIDTAERIEDATIREKTVRELEQQIDGIEEAFEKNTLDYGRKLYLIENCLYGVDIQPIAVQIAKMRFFISLIADQRVDEDAENFGVRPLPNLETKLVAANTLIGIDRPKQLTLRNPQIEAKEAELRRVRERHFLARTPAAKTRCREQDRKLRNVIAEFLKSDGWDDGTAKKLAGWDPYDQNASSEFFDPEWMFGVSQGFDVILGNPPYLESRSPAFSDELKDSIREALVRRWPDVDIEKFITRGADLLVYFLELGVSLINADGCTVLITQNAWLDTEYGKKFQEFLLKHTHVSLVVDSDFKHFDSGDGPNINTVITFFRGRRPDLTKNITFVRFRDHFEVAVFPSNGETVDKHISNARFHQYPYCSQILQTTKWGMLLSLDAAALDLLSILEKRGTIIEDVHGAGLTIGQGLNLTKAHLVDPPQLDNMPNLRKALIPIFSAKDGAPFCIRKTHYHLVDVHKLAKGDVRELKRRGYAAFDSRTTSKHPPILILPRGIGRHFCAINSIKAYSASGVDIYAPINKVAEELVLNLWAVLNSSVCWLLREVAGRKNLGGGMLKAEATDLAALPLYLELQETDILRRLARALEMREARESILELDTEEHRILDNLVFDFLDLRANRRNQIVDSLRNRLRERAEKART